MKLSLTYYFDCVEDLQEFLVKVGEPPTTVQEPKRTRKSKKMPEEPPKAEEPKAEASEDPAENFEPAKLDKPLDAAAIQKAVMDSFKRGKKSETVALLNKFGVQKISQLTKGDYQKFYAEVCDL